MQISSSINWHQILLIAILLLATISDFSFAMGERAAQPDKHQQEAIAKAEENEKLRKQSACADMIELTIAGTKFKVNRYYGSKVILSDGAEIERLNKHCDLTHINNVRSWAAPGFGLSDIHLSPNYSSTYSRLKKKIEDARAAGKSVLLKNELERIFYQGNLLYIIPLNIASGYNNEPIVFDCGNADPNEAQTSGSGTSNCGTGYPINQHIMIGYSFFRDLYPDENYIKTDREKREFFESLIVKGE